MKRTIFLFLLTISLLLTFAACGETQPATDTPGSKTDIIASVPSDNNAEVSSATKSDSDSVSTDNQTDTVSDHTDTKTDSVTETDTSGATVSTESRPTENTDTSTARTSTNTTSDKTTSTSKPTDTNTANTTSTTTSTPSVSTSTATGNGNDETEDDDTPVEMTPLVAVTPENYYGKVWLKSQSNGATLVKAYEDLAKAAEDMKKEVSFDYDLTPEQLNVAWHCYINDYPEHFWRNKGYSYSYSGDKVVSVGFEYNMSASEKTTAQQKFDNAVEQLLDGLSGSMNQYNLEKALHDKIVMSTTYKQTSHAHDAYGVLVEREAVCEGYARALQLLLRKAGIQTLIVEGAAVDPVSQQTIAHAWNIVQINGDYYHLDSTWDDAGEPDHAEGIHYAWFNVTTAQILEDHAIQLHSYEIPLCTSEKENYFRKTGKYLETLTVDGIRSQLKEKDGVYYAHIFIKNQTNAANWISQNIKAIISGLIRSGCRYSVQTTGHGLYLIITPST